MKPRLSGAGGVVSVVFQMARKYLGLQTTIATISRLERKDKTCYLVKIIADLGP